jgi:hypothetical protein
MKGTISPLVAKMLGTVEGQNKLRQAMTNGCLVAAPKVKVNLEPKKRWFDSYWFIAPFCILLFVIWAVVMVAVFFLLLQS